MEISRVPLQLYIAEFVQTSSVENLQIYHCSGMLPIVWRSLNYYEGWYIVDWVCGFSRVTQWTWSPQVGRPLQGLPTTCGGALGGQIPALTLHHLLKKAWGGGVTYVCSYFASAVNTFYTCIARNDNNVVSCMSSWIVWLWTHSFWWYPLHIGCKHYLKTMFFYNGNVSNTHFNELNSFEMLKNLIAVFLFSDTPLNQLEAALHWKALFEWAGDSTLNWMTKILPRDMLTFLVTLGEWDLMGPLLLSIEWHTAPAHRLILWNPTENHAATARRNTISDTWLIPMKFLLSMQWLPCSILPNMNFLETMVVRDNPGNIINFQSLSV